jgi:hyperosmotically inducible periplasmic protein
MQTRFKTLLMPLAMAATLAGLIGCASDGDRTVGRVIDDRMVNSNVKEALDEATVYKFDDVQVSTHNGVVQLSGFAASEDQIAKAGEIASRVDGVNRVLNNISLKLTPTGREGGYPERGTTNTAPVKSGAPVKTGTPDEPAPPAPVDNNNNSIPRDPATDPTRNNTIDPNR